MHDAKCSLVVASDFSLKNHVMWQYFIKIVVDSGVFGLVCVFP